jgi:DNA-binding transcriptional LysR family regulator
MRHATLRQLKIFESVARLSSFSRAAEELHLTQPAVSTQIRKLEEHAGQALFEQFGKKIYLTAAGTELLEHSRAIIAQFEAAEQAMTASRGVAGGRLNIAVISAGDYYFPRLLVEFLRRHRDVSLNFTVHNREGLLAELAGNRTDLAVMARPPTDLDTINLPFAPNPYVIVAAPGHELAKERNLERERIEAFVLREKGSDTWHALEEAIGALAASVNVAMQIRSTETIKQAVMAGMGISFLSAHTVSDELRAGSLVALEVEGFPVMLHWYVVQRRGKRLPPVASAFKDFLLEEGADWIARLVPVV